jgi:CDP-glycerol glycerophosphotransferase (TagB/SpsB family)
MSIRTFAASLPLIRKRFAGCWLFVDRDFKADDNAEHLYRWVMRHKPEQNIFFALNRNSPDWERLKNEGFRLVNLRSFFYFCAWLHCAWLLSSNRSGYIVKPGWRKTYATLARHRFCLLKHGVTKDFQPGLNNPRADMLITAAHPEYQAFVTDPRYVYGELELRLTGFPRHDELLRKAAAVTSPRNILIMPTWRKNLVSELIPRTGQYSYSKKFKLSGFFRQWQTVLQTPELHNMAGEQGYKLVFFPHPYLRRQVQDFCLNGINASPDAGGSLQDILANTALLITDYSSVAMDFALLRRPVLYFQFDRESFFSTDHSYTKGYFDYDKDGFGEVALTQKHLLYLVAKYLKAGCRMKENYQQRADKFFAFSDQNNCSRVYEAICEDDVGRDNTGPACAHGHD